MAENDIYRVEVLQNIGSEPSMNVFHLRESTAETVLDIPATAVVELVGETYLALAAQLSEDWRVVSINARRVWPDFGVPFTVVFGGAEAIIGSIESEVIPSQTAVLISFYTALAERAGRGRTYLPGWPEESQNEGQLVEAAYSALQGIASTEFVGPKGPFLTGSGIWNYTIWSPETALVGGRDFIAVAVRPNLATQKRRRAFPGFAP